MSSKRPYGEVAGNDAEDESLPQKRPQIEVANNSAEVQAPHLQLPTPIPSSQSPEDLIVNQVARYNVQGYGDSFASPAQDTGASAQVPDAPPSQGHESSSQGQVAPSDSPAQGTGALSTRESGVQTGTTGSANTRTTGRARIGRPPRDSPAPNTPENSSNHEQEKEKKNKKKDRGTSTTRWQVQVNQNPSESFMQNTPQTESSMSNSTTKGSRKERRKKGEPEEDYAQAARDRVEKGKGKRVPQACDRCKVSLW